jgi:hypothetical protein
VDDRDTFAPTLAQRARIEVGMSVDFWYIRRHPLTDELRVAKVELTWDEVAGDWKLPRYQDSLVHMERESDFFASEDEAREALARGEWKRERGDDDIL